MKIVSWNTLNIIHEKKYNPTSKIIKAFSNNESKRLESIANLIFLNSDCNTIICLQECNESLIYYLKLVFNPEKWNIFKLKNITTLALEYTVTICPKHYNFTQVSPLVNRNIVNGIVIIRNENFQIVNCHLKPRFATKNNIFDVLKNYWFQEQKTFLVGDFNETEYYIKKEISHCKQYGHLLVPHFGPTYKNRKSIDHIILNFKTYIKTTKINPSLLSDHTMIILEI